MSTTNRDICIESAVPVVSINSLLATNQPIDFSNAASCALPAATTIGGSSVVALASITSVATSGAVFSVTTTGIYTGIGADQIIANNLTSGVGSLISVTGLTIGTGLEIVATAATLTTGRYISFNDTTNGEVFGIGTNGHIISTRGTTPTIALTVGNGISACALGTGATDTCGTITTTGTATDTNTITVTFGKTYTTAPKAVILTPANASAAALANNPWYVSAHSATSFAITVPTGGTYGATPSWYYLVVA